MRGLMGTRIFFMFKSQFELVDGRFLCEFVYTTMFSVAGSLWGLVCYYMFYVFGFITRHLFRYDGDESSKEIGSDCSTVHSRQEDQISSNCSEESESNEFIEKETSGFNFRFQYPTSEDTNKINGETECSVFMETASTSSTRKYEFMSGQDIRGLMEEPENVSFIVQELYVGPKDDSFGNDQSFDAGLSANKDGQKRDLDEEDVNEEKAEGLVKVCNSEEILDKEEQVTLTRRGLSQKDEIASLDNNSQEKHDLSDEVQSHLENSSFSLDSVPGLIGSIEGSLFSNCNIDSVNDQLLSDREIGKESEQETIMVADENKAELIEEIPRQEDSHLCNTVVLEEEEVSEDEYIELEGETLVGKDFGKAENKHEPGELVHEETQPMDNSENTEEPSLEEKPSGSDSDDEMGFEILREHQDLIQQLKMELKYVKTGGLPTILEESETPKLIEDLKPLKIDRKFDHKDRMEEIQKFYKSYAERMRKLDVLNHQTAHALGLLRLKDTFQSNSTQKSSIPTIKSLLAQKLRPSKVQNCEANPTQKFIRELEMVYVGQACLSWEMLYWQHGKAQELQDYDPDGFHQYNQVADEYQQFQVLLQRFIESEPFQGPRIQNYAEKRCVLRSLLQVPVIRDDCLKDKGRKEGESVISIAVLTEIIEESMRVFWEFVRADKDEANAVSRGLQENEVDLHDTADLEFLTDIQANLQKKDKKLKDLLRSRNCIVKKFQKHQAQLERALFFAQVEMKLLSRVLNMSRLTRDQLVWCHKKLNEISFVNRKIHVEPSFLLFPC